MRYDINICCRRRRALPLKLSLRRTYLVLPNPVRPRSRRALVEVITHWFIPSSSTFTATADNKVTWYDFLA